jgi:hypothetical protein
VDDDGTTAVDAVAVDFGEGVKSKGSGNGMIIFCFSGLILIPDIVRSHSSWKI